MKLSYLIPVLAMLMAGTAFAQDSKQFETRPANLRNADEYSRAGSCVMGHDHATGTTPEFVKTSTGTDDNNDPPQLFRYGTIATITCDVDAVFCWVHSVSATVAADGWIDDTGSEGNRTSDEGVGGCFRVAAGTYRDAVPWAQDFDPVKGSMVSVRKLSCEGSSAAEDRVVHGWPCDADADCFYSGATCGATNNIGDDVPPAGAFLLSVATAAADCYVCMEK